MSASDASHGGNASFLDPVEHEQIQEVLQLLREFRPSHTKTALQAPITVAASQQPIGQGISHFKTQSTVQSPDEENIVQAALQLLQLSGTKPATTAATGPVPSPLPENSPITERHTMKPLIQAALQLLQLSRAKETTMAVSGPGSAQRQEYRPILGQSTEEALIQEALHLS